MVKIKRATQKDIKASLEIAKELKEWFTKRGIEHRTIDFSINKVIVAFDKGNVVGFLCYSAEGGSLKINWMGVKRDYQRRGIG